MKGLFFKVGKIFITFLVVIIVIFAILQGIARSFSSTINHYRPHIETWASDMLHKPVKVGHISATWKGIYPVIRFDDLTIFNINKTLPLIHVKEIQVNIALLKSLVHWRIVPRALRLSGTHLVVHHFDDGIYDLNGISWQRHSTQAEFITDTIQNTLEWLAGQGQLTLDKVSIDWYEKNNLVIPISDLQLKFTKKFFKHQLLGVATINDAGLQTQMRFVMNLQGDIFDKSQLKMKIFVHARRINLQHWLQNLQWHQITLRQGYLDDIKLWANWEDKRFQHAQTVLVAHDVDLSPSTSKKMTILDHIMANVYWENHKTSWSLTSDISKLRINQHDLPNTQISFSRFSTNNNIQHVFQMSYLDLNNLSILLKDNELLPDSVRSYWQRLQPTGIIQNLTVINHGPTNKNNDSFSFSGNFKQLSWKQWNKIPGVNNLQGQFSFSPQLAHASIRSENVMLDFGDLLKKPLNLNELKTDLYWQKTPQFWRLLARNVALNDDNLGLRGNFDLFKFSNTLSPIVNLLMSFKQENLSEINKYVPVGISHPKLVKWLNQAFEKGDSVDGTLLLQGALSDFPFDKNNGVFQVLMHAQNIDVNYLPNWPTLTHATADILFHGRSMDAVLKQGKILDNDINQAQARITDLNTPVLELQTKVNTSLEHGLQFINNSPLKNTFNASKYVSLEGPMQLAMNLQIPFQSDPKIKLQGNINIQPNSLLSLPKWGLDLSQLQGQVSFTENSLSSQNLKANFLNQPVHLDIKTQHPSKDIAIIDFGMQGEMPIELLQKRFNNKYWKYLSGSSPFQLTLQVMNQKNHHQVSLKLDSSLSGMAMDLPEPFKKSASEKKPLHAELSLGNSEIQRLMFKYDHLNGNLNLRETNQKWFLQDANLNLENLILFGMDLTEATISITPKERGWFLHIDSPSILGEVFIPENYQHSTIQGNFQRIKINPLKNETNKRINPANIPSLNLICRDFTYGNKRFGEIDFVATHQINGLSIDKLKANVPGMTFTSTGSWRSISNGQATNLTGSITSQNLGTALRNWGMTNNLAGGEGGSNFNLSWPDALYSPKLSALNGSLSLEFKNGRILNVGQGAEMGIGRVLNLFSLQTLPRRLNLDFSDLTQSGFSFDIISGNFVFRNGNAFTEKFYINGPVAKVQAKGRIGLASKDYDLNMIITPYVTSSIPVIATIAGGPVVGAAAWVANKVLSGPVNKISSHSYHVTGPWESPSVE